LPSKVEQRVEALRGAALEPDKFEKLLKEIKAASLPEKQLKTIANKLHGYGSSSNARKPKTGVEAIESILNYQHKRAGSASAAKALKNTPL